MLTFRQKKGLIFVSMLLFPYGTFLESRTPKCKKTITYNASKYRCIKFKRETESSQNALIVSLSANSPSEPYLDLTNFQLLKIKEKILVTNAKNL